MTLLSVQLKWHRLALAVLTILIIADTAPHPQLSPGMLQSLISRMQARQP